MSVSFCFGYKIFEFDKWNNNKPDTVYGVFLYIFPHSLFCPLQQLWDTIRFLWLNDSLMKLHKCNFFTSSVLLANMGRIMISLDSCCVRELMLNPGRGEQQGLQASATGFCMCGRTWMEQMPANSLGPQDQSGCSTVYSSYSRALEAPS